MPRVRARRTNPDRVTSFVAAIAGVVAFMMCAPTHAIAHGIPVQAKDLPVPLTWFYGAAAAALIVSFILLGSLWSSPSGAAVGWRRLPIGVDRFVQGRIVIAAGRTMTLTAILLTVAAATFGVTEVGDNLAPFAVFIGFWLIALPASTLVGDIWGALHPAHVLQQLLKSKPARATSTPSLWWAATGILLFTWFELVFPTASNVRLLGVLISGWLLINLWGVRRMGAAEWLHHHEPFSVYSGLLARLAPVERRDGRLGIRWPCVGALSQPPIAGLALMCVTLVGTVSYDGLSRTRWWTVMVADATSQASKSGIGSESARIIFGTFGLLTMVLLAYAAFEACCAAAGRLGGIERRVGDGRLADHFAPTLLPIAVGYLVAHYASFVLVQGQGLIRALSDPLGIGWNVLGTADMTIRSGLLAPATIWSIQVGAIVTGHVVALALAHDRALQLTANRRAATASQMAMLVLMLLYTVGGLYFLSEGMT